MNIIIIGDIISKVGRNVVKSALLDLKREFDIDFTVANAENVAGFRGLDVKSYQDLMEYGVDAFTSGNHIWANKTIFPILKSEKNIVVPANFPTVHRSEKPMGKGYTVIDFAGEKIALINIQGRVFMDDIDCPFRVVDDILKELDPSVKIKVVDFHAEATSEKRAMGHYLNGRVSAIVGTHTHVQTADEEILSEGIKKDIIIQKFLTGVPQKFAVATSDPIISFVVVSVDSSGKSTSIKRYIRKISL
jgi:metallophosphoesterase (TIGR00282 family)